MLIREEDNDLHLFSAISPEWTSIQVEDANTYFGLCALDFKYMDDSVSKRLIFTSKFEHCMGHFEYNDERLLKTPESIEYDDTYLTFKGKLIKVPLFEINSSDSIREKIVLPSLELFRQ